MSKEQDIIYFAENICGIKLLDWQKDLLRQKQEANDKGELILVNLGRRQGGQLVNNILINFQIWSKSQQITELEVKLAKNKKWLASNEGFLENQKLKQQLAEKEQENSHLKRAINIITSSKYGSLSKDSCKKLTDEEFKNIMQNDVYYKQIKEELSEEIKEVKTKLNSVYGINGAKQLAIDELEEVKEKLNKYNKEHCFKPIENYICERAIKFVDEQIKKVKKEMIKNEL